MKKGPKGISRNRPPGRPDGRMVMKPSYGRQPKAGPGEENVALPAGEERLSKLIAEAGLASRRGAEKLIDEGRVTVNGQVANQQGLKADLSRDRVAVDGRFLGLPQKLCYFMFHKPAGYLTTMSDPKGRPTIREYLDHLPVRVFPVGRLDMDVEGLLILTNDGALAKALMHPSSKVPKIYRVKVEGRPTEADMERLRDGSLMLDGRLVAPAEAEIIKTAEDRAWMFLTLTEGRHNQVKRMCTAIGHPVMKLKRVCYGGLELGPLRRESIRPLTAEEINNLREAAKPPVMSDDI